MNTRFHIAVPDNPARLDFVGTSPRSSAVPLVSAAREFFHPTTFTWWMYCVLVLAGSIGASTGIALFDTRVTLMRLLPLFVITLGLFALLILVFDPYRARRFWVMLLAAMAGASIPTWLSMIANGYWAGVVTAVLPDGSGPQWWAAVAGPTSEEWSKAMCVFLIMVIAGASLRRPMHGLFTGAFVGLGFQILENISYASNAALTDINSDVNDALTITVLRSVIGISSHWLYSGVVGAGVAVALGRTVTDVPLWKRLGGFCGFYLLGWGLHFVWNAPAGDSVLTLLLIPVKMIASLVVFGLVLRWCFNQERLFLVEAMDEVAAAGTGHPDLSRLSADQQMRTVVAGTRRQRRTTLSRIRFSDGPEAKKDAKKSRLVLLEALQAWGRRGTGVDELAGASVPPQLRHTAQLR
ncbi:PrsW family intramembrane metalloprotease [Corynebacterium mendelii]|uniref:PrsW family intramembrane metalloprotease n=1 Tax=Corynebacterium mendelii TaxID=2765362 RepID=A0A939E0A1_9CORY|nr:PrsW family intramembrane metalloprotease [Corynebacterium mendelii]MBN9644096.1 PrsW family intramembrane metalloprotease [Corynebacterium mendelii]